MNKTDRTYQVIRFDRSTNEFDYIKHTNDWLDAVETSIEYINKDVDRWNEFQERISNNGEYINGVFVKKDANKVDYVEYDQMFEIFENGQNWIINNHVYGIIDITIEDKKPEYNDVVVLIWDVEMDARDLNAIKIPFDNKDFFNGYMKRVVEVFGGKYEVHSVDSFDNLINDDRFDIGEEDRPYLIHTKIVK